MRWKSMFEFFMKAVPPCAGDDSKDRKENLAGRKLSALTNSVSFNVFENIADCRTYSEAIARLDRIYMKSIADTNPLFARQVLLEAKQQEGESVTDFAVRLDKISKHCKFQAVTAEGHRKSTLRDAFIRGISSTTVKQRLIDSSTINIHDAVSIAKAAEVNIFVSQNKNDPQIIHPQYAASNSRKLAYRKLWQVFDEQSVEDGVPSDSSSTLCPDCSWHNERICPICQSNRSLAK